MLNNSNFTVIPSGENILKSCNNEYWRAPAGKTGEEAEIIIDLKCPMLLESFSILNGFADFGIKEFSLFGSRDLSGPWTAVYSGELPQGIELTQWVGLCNLYTTSKNN